MAGPPTHAAAAQFPTTNWSLVQRVREGDDATAAGALETLCRDYWQPVWAFLRRQGFSREDAEDLTQVFFQRLIASETIQAARQERGRLRTFMLSLLKKVISSHRRDAAAEKRGGGAPPPIPLDVEEAEQKFARELAVEGDALAMFDRAWASCVLEAAEAKLRADFEQADNLEAYHELRQFLSPSEAFPPYAEIARRLGKAEGALRLQIHRMRKRYARLLELEILKTVEDPADLPSELAHLLGLLGR